MSWRGPSMGTRDPSPGVGVPRLDRSPKVWGEAHNRENHLDAKVGRSGSTKALDGADSESATAGVRTLVSLYPWLHRWRTRKNSTVTFRVVQVLSGHGFFSSYLHKVTRREAAPCTAQHRLQVCTAWTGQWQSLVSMIGGFSR